MGNHPPLPSSRPAPGPQQYSELSPARGSPQLGVFRQELQLPGHHVPDLAVGEPGLSLHDHRVLVVHLQCVRHGDTELYLLRGEEARELMSV